MAADGKRPFWMHQLVEYILGGLLVASGLQSHTPIVPSVLGFAILLNAASTKGAFSAFTVIDRRVHAVIDPFIIGLCYVAAVQPWISIANPTRFIIAAIATVHLVVWAGSSFAERKRREKLAPTGDKRLDFGRNAGRAVGTGVNSVKKWFPKSGSSGSSSSSG